MSRKKIQNEDRPETDRQENEQTDSNFDEYNPDFTNLSNMTRDIILKDRIIINCLRTFAQIIKAHISASKVVLYSSTQFSGYLKIMVKRH